MKEANSSEYMFLLSMAHHTRSFDKFSSVRFQLQPKFSNISVIYNCKLVRSVCGRSKKIHLVVIYCDVMLNLLD